MKIFLIRHADAGNSSIENNLTDDRRYLTPQGRKTMRKVAKHLKDQLREADIIFTSPLIRAVQTAEIIATKVKFKNEVKPENILSGEAETSKVIDFIKSNSSYNSIVLVGHEPVMSHLIISLTDKKDFTGFSKSGAALIKFDTENEAWSFQWYFDPKKFEFKK